MANNKDFKVKNGIKPTVYHEAVGTVTSGTVADITNASYDTNTSDFSNEDTIIRDIAFRQDNGQVLYVLGRSNNDIFQYNLTTGWDLSTASYSSNSFPFAQDTDGHGLGFKTDGTKMYIGGDTNNTIYQYSLSTAWDVSTASYDSKSFAFTQDIRGFQFKPDGTKLFWCMYTHTYEIDLSTAWDISTASYNGVSFDVSTAVGTDGNQNAIAVSEDGTKMFTVSSNSPDNIYQFSLSTGWDLSTASYDNINFSVTSQAPAPFGLFLKPDNTKLFVSGQTSDSAFRYSVDKTTKTLDLSTGSVFEITPTSDIQIGLSNPAASGTVSQATLLLDGRIASGDLLFFAADAGNSSDYDDATGWTTIIDLPNQGIPDTNFYLVRQTAATDGSYSISFATNNSNAFPSGGAFMCTNGATYQGVSNGTGTVSFGSGLTVGESVLFLLESGDNSNSTYTPPAGYTILFESSGTETTLTHTVVSYKIADATSESTSGGTFSSSSVYRALVHVQNSGTDATDGDMASQVQKATAVVSTFTVSDGQIEYSQGATITYPSTVEWPSGTAPTSPAIGDTDVITFSTRDGGTSYQAVQAIDGAA